MIIIAIILFLGVLCFDLISDYKKWITHRSVDHTFEAWQRAVFLVPSIIGFHLACPNNELWILLLIVPMLFFAYWLIFDGLYNKLRGFDWWFAGSDDQDDAKLDNLQQFLGRRWSKVVKICGLLTFLFFYIKLWF